MQFVFDYSPQLVSLFYISREVCVLHAELFAERVGQQINFTAIAVRFESCRVLKCNAGNILRNMTFELSAPLEIFSSLNFVANDRG